MNSIDTRNLTNEQWLELRKQGIGGSDGAAVFNLNPWFTKYDLYLDKKGIGEPIQETERMQAGKRMEPVIAQWYADREKKKIANVNRILIHPKYPFIRANVDRRIVGEKRVLECKNVDGYIFKKAEWGEEYTSNFPGYYFIQCHHYMLFPQFKEGADLAAVVGGNSLKVYRIERDKEISEMLIEGYVKFWEALQKDIPPDPFTMADVDKRYKNAIGESIEATPGIKAINKKLDFYKRLYKNVDFKIDDCKMNLKNYMKDNTVLRIDGFPTHTWKNQNDSRFQISDFRNDHPEMAEKYTNTKTIRVFR